MKSKKDQGNALYKKQKFKQAVECYKQYVSKDNDDNCKAYSNMALCYFRLKQYLNCVQSCQKAVQLQPQFEKPFYRMFQAYKQLNDQYGMLISASRFCKLSKQQKDIKAVQKQLVKVREQLCYSYIREQKKSQQEKIIDEILSMGVIKQNDSVKSKQTQMCKQSKWERIVGRVRENKRQGLNAAMRFIHTQCQSQQQKQKYKKLYNKLRTLPVDVIINGQVSNNNINSNTYQQQQLINNNITTSSESSQQSVRIEQLQKYAQQKNKRKQLQHQQRQQQQQQRQQQHVVVKSQQSYQQQQLLSSSIKNPIPQVESNNPNIVNHQPNPSPTQSQQHVQQTSQPIIVTITPQQAQTLFNLHINTKLSKTDDIFITFYQTIMSTLRSIELDRFQKQAILSLLPLRVKKFSMLMKSYTGKQKQQLQRMFVENSLYHVWQGKYLTHAVTIKK